MNWIKAGFVLAFLFMQSTKINAQANYVIPVVFHVIHKNGAENISDEQIFDQIEILNRDFNNPDTTVIIDTFKPLIADCDIEFRLATLDPDGNCTSGITRHYSSLTSVGDHQVKSIIHWPPDEYLNFYVVTNAAGLAGHALLPSQADSFPQWDGIVIGHNYTGSIGTSSVLTSVVATHEVGHYLGLQHVWGGNNVPNFFYLPVSQTSNCSTDDGVGDTPNTIGNQLCNHTQMNCGTLDNVQNFMDYSYCGAMFTHGQKDRMHAMLDSSLANRNNLWTQSNLVKTGVDTIPNWLCKAEFKVNKQSVCVGDTIVFTDLSKHQIQTREWDFVGGSSTSIADSIVKVVYSIPGNYDVRLKVINSMGSDSVVLQNYISVLPNPGNLTVVVEDMENLAPFPSDKWMVFGGHDTTIFEVNSNAGYSGSQSLYFDNFNKNGVVILESTTMNLTTSGSMELIFRHAYAEKSINNSNRLEVFFSNDCGNSWILAKTIVSVLLKTKLVADTLPFIPAGSSEWKTTTVNIPGGYQTTNFRVKFVFTGSHEGNNFYLDDINVIPVGTINIEDSWKDNIRVYPNPADSEVFLKNIPQGSLIKLFDTKGKLIHSQVSTLLVNKINLKGVKKGSYLLKITYEGAVFGYTFVKK